MKHNALEHANGRLERARKALDALKTAQANWDGKEAETHWSAFLIAASGIYSKLEQGAKGNGKSEAWYGRVKHKRKNDELLSYIHHARNSDEHSLELVSEHHSGITVVPIPPYAWTENGTLQVSRNTPVGTQIAQALPPGLRLLPVSDNRYKDTFPVPRTHLNQPIIGIEPVTVAIAALAYLEKLAGQAVKFLEK